VIIYSTFNFLPSYFLILLLRSKERLLPIITGQRIDAETGLDDLVLNFFFRSTSCVVGHSTSCFFLFDSSSTWFNDLLWSPLSSSVVCVVLLVVERVVIHVIRHVVGHLVSNLSVSVDLVFVPATCVSSYACTCSRNVYIIIYCSNNDNRYR